MTNRRSKLAGLSPWLSITALLVVLAPSTVFATHFELSRLALHIEAVAELMAEDLRYTRHYGSVRQRAATLRREASQLAEALQRNRSNSRIRSRFKDVRRSYERLEQAFFIADRRDHIPSLYQEVSLLSDAFASLSDEFYYAGLGGQSYGPFYSSRRSGISISSSRRFDERRVDPRRDGARSGYNRGNGSRSTGRILPGRERAIPQVFRGPNDAGVNRQGGRNRAGERTRGESRTQPGRAGQGRGSARDQSESTFDHRSNVLDRQERQNTERAELENQTRRSQPAESRGRSARESGVQRSRNSRGGRGSAPESRRRVQ